ncbi:MAG: protein phosphatase 2C domain-containing protein [Pseudolysinimonas sp.]|uniref:PP2C family protein-serine/threonine phosphatase n=1 Tax=Pseudolysinimonas sp. TaxID=2680009 RepID=UPI003C79439B
MSARSDLWGGSSGIQLAVAAVTDAGLKREVNEDSYLAEPPVFLVADGMGGYEAGDRASAAVVAAFRGRLQGREFAAVDDVRDALLAADDEVAAVASRTSRGAGSTAAGMVLVQYAGAPHWLVFNVGDSRVYRHVDGVLEQLTVDHSLAQELIQSGELRPEDLATFTDRNVITRAIGAPESLADSWLLPVVDGERFLVCSDGLHSEIGDEGIRTVLMTRGDPEAAATDLLALAIEQGGRDNISIIVLDVIAVGGSTIVSIDDLADTITV